MSDIDIEKIVEEFNKLQKENKELKRIINEYIVGITGESNVNGYIIKKCNHCHKYFSVNPIKSRRKIYCDRKSPYKGFEHLDCEQAVRNILLKLKRKRIKICETISNKDDFLSTCKIYMDKIKKQSGVENLKEYEQFLWDYI